ncbi:MAG: sigma-70 family RNA polymerase sigma factor [Solirubrobacteraceae bacterium]
MDAPTATDDPARALVLATIGEHAGTMLRVARRYSLCADDANDAYQRGLEIFLRRADSVEPATAAAWLRTVVKHEALAVRASRRRVLTDEGLDPDREEARHLVPADERLEARERVERSAEALQRLKPQEVRALLLKARGYSYAEIQEITGWTYTKVNRCLTEGRRAFLDRFADIEAGRECERWTPLLSAIADGEAGAQDVVAARPHLRHCVACRARLRDYRAAPGAVAALAPVSDGLAPQPTGGHGLLARAWELVAGGAHERTTLAAVKLQAAVETLSAGKMAAVAASATALAGGGVAVVEGTGRTPVSVPGAAVLTTAAARIDPGQAAPGADTPAEAAPPGSGPATPAPSPEGPEASRPPSAPAAAAVSPAAAEEFGVEPSAPASAAPSPPSCSPPLLSAPAPAARPAPAAPSTRSSTEFVP